MTPSLPGTLPGLLRRGAPVVEIGECATKGAIGSIVTRAPKPGDTGLRVWWQTPAELEGMVTSVTHGTALDLSDPLGADIAARWLAKRVGLAVGVTAPRWERDDCHADWGGTMWRLIGEPSDTPVSAGWFASEAPEGTWHAVPGISAITDPLAALAAACLHVGSMK